MFFYTQPRDSVFRSVGFLFKIFSHINECFGENKLYLTKKKTGLSLSGYESLENRLIYIIWNNSNGLQRVQLVKSCIAGRWCILSAL